MNKDTLKNFFKGIASHPHRPMHIALSYCGIYDAVLHPLVLDNPELTPRYTTHETCFVWVSGDRQGIVNSKGFRVSEFMTTKKGVIGGSNQKPLPFGGRVRVEKNLVKGEKAHFVDHRFEKEYSELRFSLYGTG